jgi:hypothetical protein
MKKLDQQSIDALRQPDTKALYVELTPELKEKFKRASDEIVAVLRRYTKGPMEAYSLLILIKEGFEETYDIRGSIQCNNDDIRKGD